MREIQTTLKNIQDKIQDRIDNRDAMMNNRIKVWQESEQGVTYQLTTEILNDVIYNIATAIESLEKYLE